VIFLYFDTKREFIFMKNIKKVLFLVLLFLCNIAYGMQNYIDIDDFSSDEVATSSFVAVKFSKHPNGRYFLSRHNKRVLIVFDKQDQLFYNFIFNQKIVSFLGEYKLMRDLHKEDNVVVRLEDKSCKIIELREKKVRNFPLKGLSLNHFVGNFKPINIDFLQSPDKKYIAKLFGQKVIMVLSSQDESFLRQIALIPKFARKKEKFINFNDNCDQITLTFLEGKEQRGENRYLIETDDVSPNCCPRKNKNGDICGRVFDTAYSRGSHERTHGARRLEKRKSKKRKRKKQKAVIDLTLDNDSEDESDSDKDQPPRKKRKVSNKKEKKKITEKEAKFREKFRQFLMLKKQRELLAEQESQRSLKEKFRQFLILRKQKELLEERKRQREMQKEINRDKNKEVSNYNLFYIDKNFGINQSLGSPLENQREVYRNNNYYEFKNGFENRQELSNQSFMQKLPIKPIFLNIKKTQKTYKQNDSNMLRKAQDFVKEYERKEKEKKARKEQMSSISVSLRQNRSNNVRNWPTLPKYGQKKQLKGEKKLPLKKRFIYKSGNGKK